MEPSELLVRHWTVYAQIMTMHPAARPRWTGGWGYVRTTESWALIQVRPTLYSAWELWISGA